MARRKEKFTGDEEIRRENLKKLIDDKNLRNDDVAALTKLSAGTISRLLSETSGQIIHDKHVKLLSRVFKIDPAYFDTPQSGEANISNTESQSTSESDDNHINFRPNLSPFSKREDSQYKKSAIELVKEFHYLGNLEKLSYEEIWEHTKTYFIKIKDVTKDCVDNELILIYSMSNDVSIKEDFFDLSQPFNTHPDPIFLNFLGNFSRKPLKDYWEVEIKNLNDIIEENLEYINELSVNSTLVVFALAPQPLVVELGRRLSNIKKLRIYPTFRKENFEVGWGWHKGQHYVSETEYHRQIDYKISKPNNKMSNVALNLSLSSSVPDHEIEQILGSNTSIWKLYLEKPDDDCVQARQHLTAFTDIFKNILKKIVGKHGKQISLHVFLSVPIIIAFEIGRIWNSDTYPELILYGLNNESGGFYPIHTITKDLFV